MGVAVKEIGSGKSEIGNRKWEATEGSPAPTKEVGMGNRKSKVGSGRRESRLYGLKPLRRAKARTDEGGREWMSSLILSDERFLKFRKQFSGLRAVQLHVRG